MPQASLYLFDGSNLFHAGAFAHREELVDTLASFVATRGARGVVVFDGTGESREVGPLSVRFAQDADTVLERLAVEQFHGQVGSIPFLAELERAGHREDAPSRLGDRVDEATRERLERLRRGES